MEEDAENEKDATGETEEDENDEAGDEGGQGIAGAGVQIEAFEDVGLEQAAGE